ncbi:spore germination protein GerPC [Bacillus haimaensis]|uniref:spore germination protein GerPC n=1 Tax=Bacillus haimaensis TaxID=3160967 RepID=UPI003AA9C6BE
MMMNEKYSVDDKVRELEQKLFSLISQMEKMKKERTIHYHIQHLEIKEAAFEQLHYHLDSISIENLSGTLNIGNNFDGGVQGKPHPSQPDMPKQKNTPIPVKGKGVNDTNSKEKQNLVKSHSKQSEKPRKDLIVTPQTKGYSVTFKKKEENQ